MSSVAPETVVQDSASGPLRFRLAFERVQAELAAIPREQVQTLNVDVAAALATTLGSLVKIKPLRQAIVEQVGGFDIKQFDNLETYALALMQAQVQFTAASRPLEPIDELNAELTQTRELLLRDLLALEGHRLVDARQGELRGANGYKNLTTDILHLCSIFRDHWAAIQGKTGTQIAQLDRAEMLADRLITAVGLREQGAKAALEQADIRLRAFTLFARAHDEVRRVVMYLRWHENDADTIFPTVFGGGRNHRTKVEQPPTAPQPSGDGGTPPVVTNPTPAFNPSTAPGMPGSSALG